MKLSFGFLAPLVDSPNQIEHDKHIKVISKKVQNVKFARITLFTHFKKSKPIPTILSVSPKGIHLMTTYRLVLFVHLGTPWPLP